MAYYAGDSKVICKYCGNTLHVYSDIITRKTVIGSSFEKCPKCGKEVFNKYVKEFECLTTEEQIKLIPFIQDLSKKEGKMFLKDGTYVITDDEVVASILRTQDQNYCNKLIEKGFIINHFNQKKVYIKSKRMTLFDYLHKEEK